ncbi:MAG TPA: phytanoyl-CoA dioxygenase family protein [Alphaproteobacteria bacterium]|nr:phytanoyl-CoA dioxygenase family protein [Alphaproteobacteria bacterium]
MPDDLPFPIDDETIERYRRDGVVCLRGVFDAAWRERLEAAVERVLAKPGPLGMRYGNKADHGTFFGDMFMWTFDDGFRDFAFDSPAAAIAGTLMGSQQVCFFYDHLLVKEPDSESRTPWHHDYTYWCAAGRQLCSIWMALDPVTAETGAVEYVRGSHLWDAEFRAQDFRNGTIFHDAALPPVPDIEAARGDYDIVSFDTEPGDCVVFDFRTLHGAPGNRSAGTRRRALSTRWAGDDVVYVERPAMQQPIRDPGLKPGEPLASELFPPVWHRHA